LDALDAALELADVVEVLVQAGAIARPELALQLRNLPGDPVEDAAIGAAIRGALLRRCADAEELIEDGPRIADHRQRLRRRRPADRVGVDAGVAVSAAASLIHILDRELHRRDRRFLTVLLRV